MFLQLIFARAADREGLRRQCNRWHDELATAAVGWRGSTMGVTDDGRFVAAIRFESAEAARANSDRPAQHTWWRDMQRHLDGPAEFVDAADVSVVHDDDPGAAGFVQVMRARVADRPRFEEVEARISPAFVELRPDVLAAYRAWPADDRVVAIDYFRSEAEARAGERKEMPEELRVGFGEWMGLLSDHQWFDLTDPWLRMT